MKKSILFCLLLSIISCQSTVEKPEKLIEKDKMIDIMYDLSLLEAIKSQNINGGISNESANEYLYKKYKIDSIQLVQNNKYYATDVEEYKKMFEEVKSRLVNETQKPGVNPTTTNESPNADTPQIQ